MENVEARSRLSSVLDVCENESNSLRALGDPRLNPVLEAMAVLQAEIVSALALLSGPGDGLAGPRD
jgi:hypothetical protein